MKWQIITFIGIVLILIVGGVLITNKQSFLSLTGNAISQNNVELVEKAKVDGGAQFSKKVSLSDLMINDKISGEYAVGILSDNINLSEVLTNITLTEESKDCSGILDEKGQKDICKKVELSFEGNVTKVYVLGSAKSLEGVSFPFDGRLIGDSIPNAEQRLIQMMEEDGNARYKIVK